MVACQFIGHYDDQSVSYIAESILHVSGIVNNTWVHNSVTIVNVVLIENNIWILIDYLQFWLIRVISHLRANYLNWSSVTVFIKKEDFQFMAFALQNEKINRNEDDFFFINSCLTEQVLVNPPSFFFLHKSTFYSTLSLDIPN